LAVEEHAYANAACSQPPISKVALQLESTILGKTLAPGLWFLVAQGTLAQQSTTEDQSMKPVSQMTNDKWKMTTDQ
jgi:hypothetical protein